MAVTHSRYTVGTTLARVVADSPDSQEVWLQNLAPENTVEAYAKEGKAFLVQREFAVAKLCTCPLFRAKRFQRSLSRITN